MLLPHISIYIKIYQFNKIYGKWVGLQVRKRIQVFADVLTYDTV